MKFYYTNGDCWGWIPNKSGLGGKYFRFPTVEEYQEAYREATAS